MRKGQGFAREVTLDNLAQFAPLLKRPFPRTGTGSDQDQEEDQANTTSVPAPEYQHAEQAFVGQSIRVSLPYRIGRTSRSQESGRSRRQHPAGTGQRQRPGQPAVGIPPPAPTHSVRGPVVWQKQLSRTDAQRQTGNPTGNLRLAQARFRVNGELIDQTTYSRNNLFGDRPWHLTQSNPRKEETTVEVDVTILGSPYGVQRLTLSHQPSRISNQRNVPTVLHWGPLAGQVYSLNLDNRTLTLCAPVPGTDGPYFIEIT